MSNWYCDDGCIISKNGAGPWDDKHESFLNIKHAHKNCPGFQKGEPKLKGKNNWGQTECEIVATKVFNEHIDEWFRELITSLKDSNNVCLIKNKLKLVNQS